MKSAIEIESFFVFQWEIALPKVLSGEIITFKLPITCTVKMEHLYQGVLTYFGC